MIQFKRGEFFSGDTSGIVVPDFDEHSKDDLFLNPLAEDCWILTVSYISDRATLDNVDELEFDFVPSEQDVGLDSYDMFWASELTVLFASYDDAISFIKSYTGPYEEEIGILYDNLLNPIDDVGDDQ